MLNSEYDVSYYALNTFAELTVNEILFVFLYFAMHASCKCCFADKGLDVSILLDTCNFYLRFLGNK